MAIFGHNMIGMGKIVFYSFYRSLFKFNCYLCYRRKVYRSKAYGGELCNDIYIGLTK